MWATITLKEGGSYDAQGKSFQKGKPFRTNQQSLINWAKKNSRLRVVEESEPVKIPKKPKPTAKAVKEEQPKEVQPPKPVVTPRPPGRPKKKKASN